MTGAEIGIIIGVITVGTLLGGIIYRAGSKLGTLELSVTAAKEASTKTAEKVDKIAASGAALETRIAVVETRVDGMQEILRVLVEPHGTQH